MKENRHTALVLQGGGALGAYEYGVIKALYERPGFHPSVVTGVSIGALNAAVLAGNPDNPVAALGQMWSDLSVADFPYVPDAIEQSLSMMGNDAMYRIDPSYIVAPFLATSFYDTSPLRKSLEKWLDFDKLNSSKTYVAVTAVNIENGELETFDNRSGLTPDHLMASTSLPPAFPATQIDGKSYWDGGLISDAPLARALNVLEDPALYDENIPAEVIVVDLFRQKAEVPAGLMDVLWRTFEIMFSSKLKHDLAMFRQVNDYIGMLDQLKHSIPATDPIRDHPGFKALTRYRKIDRLTVINNDDSHDVGGPADFSASAIRRRVARGYEDTMNCLQER